MSAGHEQHPRWRRSSCQPACQLDAIHDRHEDVADDQVDRGCPILKQGQCLETIPCDEDAIALIGHHSRHVSAQQLLVIHHQDRALHRNNVRLH